jgi:hypothetical protein
MEDKQQKQYVDCGALSPSTKTAYTLIGAKHTWRLQQVRKEDGTVVVERRCPACWTRFQESVSRRGRRGPPIGATAAVPRQPPGVGE